MDVQTDSGDGKLAVAGWGSQPHWGIYATLFLVSTGLLCLEVSLTRFFSFTIWYHFAYLTISMALLGFGASGAIVAAFPRIFRRNGHVILVGVMTVGALLTVAALAILARHPLEVLDVTKKPLAFSASLLGYYGAIGLPFLLAGFAVSVPFAAYPQLMGRLYFWDLLGAASGCLLVVSLIEVLGVPGLIITAAGLLLAAAGALGLGTSARKVPATLLAAGAALIMIAAPLGNQLHINVTSTKRLRSYVGGVRRPDSYIKWTALNRVDAVGWEKPTKLQYWATAGIVKGYNGPLPDVGHVTYDGSNGSNIYSFSGSFDDYAMLDRHLLRIPYLLQEKPEVLVIGVGGGIDMMNAIKRGAKHVTGVELQPKTVYLLKEYLHGFTGGFYDRPDVTLLAGEGRHFVRKSHSIFDLIQITAVDTFAAQATGAYVLAESYLYTVEAAKDYMAHLSPAGLLSMVVGDLLYRDSLPPLSSRLALIGYRALEGIGVTRPADHLMVVGAKNSRGTARSQDILVKKTAFTAAEVGLVKEFAQRNGFEILYAPSRIAPDSYPLAAILGSDEPKRQEALDKAWFRMDAVHDGDPFFYNVGKWKNFTPRKGLLFLFPGSFLGQLVLVLMVAQSALLGAVLIILPLLRGAREGLRAPGVVSYLAYFLALGVGFMFIEISFVQSFVLFLGSPTHALSVTIFSLLLFASIGSFISTRFVDRPEWALRRLMVIAAALVLTYAVALSHLFDAFLHLELSPRILIAIAVQLPMGLTLGMFMPLGIACVSRQHPRLVPWAWGINGIGSVVGTTLAVLLAMSWGFTVVSISAAALYLVGTTLMLQSQGPPQSGEAAD